MTVEPPDVPNFSAWSMQIPAGGQITVAMPLTPPMVSKWRPGDNMEPIGNMDEYFYGGHL